MEKSIQWSYYLGRIKHEFGVVVCYDKKVLKLSKVGRLWSLLNCFVFYGVGFWAIFRDNNAQILEL